MAAPGAEESRRSVPPLRARRQAEQEPVRGRSLPELRELLRRQERLLGDRALASRLPDGGRRVAECVERLRVAVAHEERRRPGQEAAAGSQVSRTAKGAREQQERPESWSEPVRREESPKAPGGPTEPLAASASGSPEALAGAFGSLSAAELEAKARNPTTPRSRFETNVLPGESSGSGIPSPGGLSASERRHRDKKHLDDVTAARLPPLHHKPTQLVSIAESIAIQMQQKEVYEEMQAKVAVQRLTERLGIKMDHYEPEGKVAFSYREVRDEEGYSSTED